MTRPGWRSIGGLLIAGAGLSTTAHAQNSQKPVAAACPAPAEVVALHLYGAWQARWEGVDEPAAVTLGRNPDHPDGVRGSIRRGTAEALVAGDVHEGDFTLEESTDGRSISATWTGQVVQASCGKEIQGLWTRASDTVERRFVLRKLPGWQ